MIRITLGGRPCLHPGVEASELAAHGWPAPADFVRANALVNPLGREPARGWLCLLRSDLARLDLDALQTLTLDDGTNKLSAHNLVVTREPVRLAQSLTAADPDGSYLVEVADARWRVRNPHYCVPVNKQYNVRAQAWGNAGSPTIYAADSLQGGTTAWTWLSMVQDLWGLMVTQLGTAPAALPFTPDGTPEGWVFPGVPAWDALCDVLERIGCAVAWTPTKASGAYSIVRVGAADAATSAALTLLETKHRKIHDGEFYPVVRGKVPASARVCFHRVELYGGTEETTNRATGANWQQTAVYTVDVAGPESSEDTESGSYALLWDDLPALYDGAGALTNAAALATRAAERSADFFRMLRDPGGSRLYRVYSGLAAIAPGSILKGVAWRQSQADGGLTTEVIRHPFARLRVSDSGAWEECCPSSRPTQPPAFGPTWPLYPIVSQILKLANGSPSSGKYDAVIEKSDGTWTSPADRESVWAVDLAGAASLTAGDRYLCRLVGFASSRPLYAFRSAAGTVTGPVTFNNAVTFNSTATFNGGVTFNNSVTYSNSSTTTWQTNSTVTDNSTTTYGGTYNATYQSGSITTYNNGSSVTYQTGSTISNDSTENYTGTYTGTFTNGSTVTYNSGVTVTYVAGSTLTFNGTVTYGNNSTTLYGVTNSTSTAPGTLSLPTLTVAGPPTWTPGANQYPIEWDSSSKTLYAWDGSSWDTIGGGGSTVTKGGTSLSAQQSFNATTYSTITNCEVTGLSTGDYIFFADVRGSATLSSPGAVGVSVELYDVTAAASITDSQRILFDNSAGTAGTAYTGVCSITGVRYTVPNANTTVALRAKRLHSSTYSASSIDTDADGKTTLNWVKIA